MKIVQGQACLLLCPGQKDVDIVGSGGRQGAPSICFSDGVKACTQK